MSETFRTVRSHPLLAGVSVNTSTPSPTRPLTDKTRKLGPSLAAIASTSTVGEAKRHMSIGLYKSIPIRLLAYSILIFNTLLVISVMADSKTFHSLMSGREHNHVNEGQIVLDSGPQVTKKIPCVAAASHNDEMQAAPFVSLVYFYANYELRLRNVEADCIHVTITCLKTQHRAKQCH